MVATTQTNPRDDDFVVRKWSSKPSTPAESKLVRSRINQRRHRERVRCRITDLESSLTRVQEELQAAQSTIRRLNAELEAAATSSSATTTGPSTNCAFCGTTDAPQHLTPPIYTTSPSISSPLQKLAATLPEIATPAPTVATIASRSPLLPHMVLATSDPENHEFTKIMRSEERTCRYLAPPSNKESTTRCGEACSMVTAHNFAGIEVAALLSWLRPGFRGATEEGGECRVENVLLFALLDYIS